MSLLTRSRFLFLFLPMLVLMLDAVAAQSSDHPPLSQLLTDDNRIFHRAEYSYDWVTGVLSGKIDQSAATFELQMYSGDRANLRLIAVAPGVVRMQFWEGTPQFQQTSPMLLPLPVEYVAHLEETPDAFYFSSFGAQVAVTITKSPFALSVQDQSGHTSFETDTDDSIGDIPIAPSLGFRRSATEQGTFISFHLRNQEHTFGLSEKFDKVEKTGTRATIWGADTLGTNTLDLAYKAIPLLFSDCGWGLMLHSSAKNYWEIGSFSTISGSALTLEPQLDTFLFSGRDLKELLYRYTGLTGRPSMPPIWAMGIWMSRATYMSRAQVEDVVAQARARKFPLDVIHIDGWLQNAYYQKLGVDACDFVWNQERFPGREEMFKTLAAEGVSVSLWTNPYLPEGSAVYEEAAQKGYLVHDAQGGVSRLEFGEHAGAIDFTNSAAVEWWKEHLRELLRAGASVLKADYGDRIPVPAVFYNGQTGATMHNLYTMLYTKAVFDAVREVGGAGMVWRRAGYIGSQRYPGTWAGDTQPTWEGMKSALRGGLSAGLSGEAFWSNDIGGFNGRRPDPELYTRWAQFGLFAPLSRFHGTTPREPWAYDAETERIVTKYARLRYRLMPYLLRAAKESTETGVPIMRHMALQFPDEPNVQTLDDQYAFGDDLIVAPILVRGARSRVVYLPRGKWRAFESPQRVYTGPGFTQVSAPLDTLPVFVRQGAHVPMLAHDVQSLKDPRIFERTVEWPAAMLHTAKPESSKSSQQIHTNSSSRQPVNNHR